MKLKSPTHMGRALPRQSWSAENLYNLFRRTYGPQSADTKFTKSSLTMFQQKWKAKKLVRAYHGDWLGETKFKKEYLPDALPRIVSRTDEGEEKVPLGSMMFVEVEKRIDTVVFRCCFANSTYQARQMVIHGKVSLNGVKHRDPNTKLQPGDLISVDPSAVVTLRPQPASASPSSSSSDPTPSTDSATTDSPTAPTPPEASADPADPSTTSPSSPSSSPSPSPPSTTSRPLPFHLPDFAAPFLFIPPYLEPSFQTCSAIYLRHPTVGPGKSEIPSPYDADGEVMRLAWEYYVGVGKRTVKKPEHLKGKRQGA